MLVHAVGGGDPANQGDAVRRVAAKCARLRLALVLDCTAQAVVMPALCATLADVMGCSDRPPAVSVVVTRAHADALRGVSFQLAMQGIILGDFTSMDAALTHACRERSLVLAESSACSASKLRRVKSISAKARC